MVTYCRQCSKATDADLVGGIVVVRCANCDRAKCPRCKAPDPTGNARHCWRAACKEPFPRLDEMELHRELDAWA